MYCFLDLLKILAPVPTVLIHWRLFSLYEETIIIRAINICLSMDFRLRRTKFRCNGMNREDVKASPDLAFGLFCHVPLYKNLDFVLDQSTNVYCYVYFTS